MLACSGAQVRLLRSSLAGSGVNQEMRKVVTALTDQLRDKTEMAETQQVHFCVASRLTRCSW